MIKLFFKLSLFGIILLLAGCINQSKANKTEEAVVDFGNPQSVNVSDLISDCSYLALESSENSLLGNIAQMQVYDNKIYILDDKTNAFFVFGKDGKFITKLEGTGSGPGEFIVPHSFWIDECGYVLILDRQLNRLLKYRLNNLEFVQNIALPAPSPISFAVIPGRELYMYYYPLRADDVFSGKQFIVADGEGTVIRSYYDAPPMSKILHGNSANFYMLNNRLRTYPHFSNQVCELNGDSLNCCYTLSWGSLQFPPTELFQKYSSSGEVMKAVLTGENDWIRLIYVYELSGVLAVKYYIKRNLLLSVWYKQAGKTMNVKGDEIVDDWGMGGRFPLPIAVCDDKFIGAIHPFDVEMDQVKDERLINLLTNMSEESNPILVFYDFRVPEAE